MQYFIKSEDGDKAGVFAVTVQRVIVCTSEVGNFHFFDLLQLLVVLLVFVQQPVVVLALGLVLLLQVVKLLLQVVMLVLTQREDYCHHMTIYKA